MSYHSLGFAAEIPGGGFILDSECTSRVIKLDSKQKKQNSASAAMEYHKGRGMPVVVRGVLTGSGS
jgi:hypothetical protein